MMAKGKEHRPVFMVRKGLALVPETDMDAEAIINIPHGHSVEITLKRERSNPRLRAYWQMLYEVVKATDCAPSEERLHEAVKLQTGYIDRIRLGNGMTVAIPGSVAFDKMTEDEFVRFFKGAERWLAQTYGWVSERAA